MKKFCLDLETYSSCNLKDEGLVRYAAHPSTLIRCISIENEQGKVKTFVPDFLGGKDETKLLQDFFDLVCDRKAQIIAHNYRFELELLNHCIDQFGVKLKRPLHFDDFICTQEMSRVCRGPAKMEFAAPYWLGPSVLKDMEGNQLMVRTCVISETEPAVKECTVEGTEASWVKVPTGYVKYNATIEKAVQNYCAADVRVTWELYRKLEGVLDITYNKFLPVAVQAARVTRAMNTKGVRIDEKRRKQVAEGALEIQDKFDAYASKHFGVTRGAQKAKCLESLREQGLKIKSFDTLEVMKANINPKNDKKLLEKLNRYKELSTISAKKAIQAENKMHNGRIYDMFTYCGASATGRWASLGVQLQNLPKPSLPSEDIEAWKGPIEKLAPSAARSMFVPDEGEVFFDSDFAQIEARLAFWFAGEKEALENFAKGKDIYSEFASKIYGKKITKKDPERQVGKKAILSLQFGQGASKFGEAMLQDTGKPFSEAKKVVDTYRKTFPGIVAEWKRLNDMMMESLHKGTPLVIDTPTGRKLHYGLVKRKLFKYKDGTSAYKPAYYNAGKRVWQGIWGGSLFNNLVQSTAGDIIKVKMGALLEKGYVPSITLHDAVTYSIPESKYEEVKDLWEGCCQEFLDKYFSGLPLAYDSKKLLRYE